MDKKSKLTPTQERAWLRLTDKWLSSYSLGLNRATLNALVRKGYAECKQELGGFSFPRTSILYRLPVKEKEK